MRKYLFPILLACLIGFLFGQKLLADYDIEKVGFASFEGEKLYFFQQGVYSSKESMEENTLNLEYYIYNEEDGTYRVFLAITKDKENVKKLEKYFSKSDYNTYVKEINITNKKFLTVLEQYDKLLRDVDDEKMIKTICKQVLSKYDEGASNEY